MPADAEPSLPVLSERIAHERELRVMASGYETMLRQKSDEHETETRELVTRLQEHSRLLERQRIEERLEVLNNERARQEADRGTFATRKEVGLSFDALAEKTAASIHQIELAISAMSKSLGDEIRLLTENAKEAKGKKEGTSSVTSWLLPSLGSAVAIVIGIATMFILLSGPRVTL